MSTRIIIIGGFLGSGKTTMIRELGKLFAADDKTIGYFTNEAGEITLDGDLMNYDIQTKEITMACVTCNLKEAMTTAVEQFIEKIHPDILFIEPKETVSPLVVKDELEKASLKAGMEEYEFAPLLTLINCAEFFKNIKDKRKITLDQITVSEMTVLNKTDLVRESELEMIRESIRQINQNTIIFENSFENEIEYKKIKEYIKG